MSLFQKSVLKKYLNDLDKEDLQNAWVKFQAHFQNTTIQQNILKAKEEEYQEGFVRDLFVNILGYTLNPQPDYNFVLEQKSTSDATKSDGAILSPEGQVVGVIELKDTNTTDLGKVEKQAFGYKYQHKDCRYVITSNFQQLRLYINDAIDFETFDLFRLGKESFAILYCCLQQTAMHNDIPLKMKQQSVAAEENITKKLYDDYSRFKKQLFENITSQNPQFDPLLLFKKTQKLLDRFLFILFAEDRLLLPPNSVREILNQWDQLKELDNYVPLYARFKKYFGYLNSGYTGKQYEIFAYNGGLFAPDEILDKIIIGDQLLYDSCKQLSNYDFESEVDVNILGHIFEHSLNEIEEIEQQLNAGEAVVPEKKTSKRKKDGVFYTPRYITKYIVENTIGSLCLQKKLDLNIIDEEFAPQKRKANTQQLLQKLETYREWLLQLTICDPACGSGAFLNQALEFLITEHQSIDALNAKLFGDTLLLSDVENSILENNLYGVDINDEATEIAKLSLWLRTARKGRKLNSLNQHIKCGNSLIEDPEIAGDKAFNWQKEFPEVFAKGGFDVVIGNPPYVPAEMILNNEKSYYYLNYSTVEYQINTFTLFIEKSIFLINRLGKYGLIVPNYFVSTKYDQNLRKKIIFENGLIEIFNLFNVFESATVDTLILIGQRENATTFQIKSISKKLKSISERLNALTQNQLAFDREINLLEIPLNYQLAFEDEIALKGELKLGDIVDFKKGMQPYEEGKGNPRQTRAMMNQKVYHSNIKIDDTFLPLLTASSIKRNLITLNQGYIKYGDNLAAKRNERIFKEERILLNRILSGNKFDACYLDETIINNSDIFNIIKRPGSLLNISLKTVSSIITSSLCAYYFRQKNVNLTRSAFPKVNVNTLETFPIPKQLKLQEHFFKNKADIMLSKNKELQQLKQQFLQLLQSKYEGILFSKKLQDWPALSFKEFLKELEKQKIKLSLPEQAEWMQYFEAEKIKANIVSELIAKTDKEIDEMVYDLYELTEEERVVVEEK
ncbi:MAG: N-6 DNA methylase [Ginsengibacter sp.]